MQRVPSSSPLPLNLSTHSARTGQSVNSLGQRCKSRRRLDATAGLMDPSKDALAQSAICSRSPQPSRHRIQEQYAACSRRSPSKCLRALAGSASMHCLDAQKSSIRLTKGQYLLHVGDGSVCGMSASKASASWRASAGASSGTLRASRVHNPANLSSPDVSSCWMISCVGASELASLARAVRSPSTRSASCSAEVESFCQASSRTVSRLEEHSKDGALQYVSTPRHLCSKSPCAWHGGSGPDRHGLAGDFSVSPLIQALSFPQRMRPATKHSFSASKAAHLETSAWTTAACSARSFLS
mmetsp:Transcript_92082/g.214013  ORF Transcript_92082/g.214013 Transcript_92082/m.214013 type:complete len:298 (-) Transcript_92082:447-1340(-)